MISGLSFRPRPIDVNRTIPIIRKEIETEDVELTGVISRSLPLMPTGMEAEDEEEAHIQEAIKQSLSGIQPDKVAIPTPDVKVVEGYDEAEDPKPFVRPQTYIRYKDLTDDEYMQRVVYDLDPEDEKFLRQLNAAKKILSESKLELIIDKAEKEAAKIGGKIPHVSTIETLLPELKQNQIHPVYNYWIKKRERNNGSPLITDLIEPPDPEDPDPYKPFRRRTDEFKQANRRSRKNDLQSLMKMKQLRHEMEKSRTLLEMIKKREKMKRDKLEVMLQLFDLQCSQIGELETSDEPLSTITKRKKRDTPPLLEDEPETPPAPDDLMMVKQPTPKKLATKADVYEFDEKDASESEEEGEPSPSSEYSPSEESPPTSPRQSKRAMLIDEDIATPSDRMEGEKGIENGVISHIPKPSPLFRGRVRIGRGGRIVIDRTPVHRTNGIVHCWESDQESNERINSIADLHRSGFHPLMCGRTDAEKLLKKFLQQQSEQQQQPKRRKRD